MENGTSFIREDCLFLVDKFLSKHSTSFSDFKACWEELSFHSIYKILPDRNQRFGITLTEELFRIGMDFLTGPAVSITSTSTSSPLSPSPTTTTTNTSPSTQREPSGEPPSGDHLSSGIYRRLGGLYLIWSIFYTRTIAPKVLVHATIDSWKELSRVHGILREKKLHEGDYMLCKLKADSAFLICYTSAPMCVPLHANFTKEQLLSQFIPTTSKSLSFLESSLSGPVEEYARLKEKLSMFLPHHLLAKPTLCRDLKRLLPAEPQ